MLLLSENLIVASWGISDIVIDESYLQFSVNGLQFSGIVKLVPNHTHCHIYFCDGSHFVCAWDILVTTLDNYIEKTANYMTDLKSWINLRLLFNAM